MISSPCEVARWTLVRIRMVVIHDSFDFFAVIFGQVGLVSVQIEVVNP